MQPNPITNIETQDKRRNERHAKSQPRRAQNRAMHRGAGPRAPVIEEQRALHAGEPRGAERESDREKIEDREPVFGIEQPSARAGDVAVIGLAREAPRSADVYGTV